MLLNLKIVLLPFPTFLLVAKAHVLLFIRGQLYLASLEDGPSPNKITQDAIEMVLVNSIL